MKEQKSFHLSPQAILSIYSLHSILFKKNFFYFFKLTFGTWQQRRTQYDEFQPKVTELVYVFPYPSLQKIAYIDFNGKNFFFFLMVKTCQIFCFIVVSRSEKSWEQGKIKKVTLKCGRRVGRKDRQDIFKENGKCSFFFFLWG